MRGDRGILAFGGVPGKRSITGTVTTGTTKLASTGIVGSDVGRSVSGTGIPPGTTIVSVTPGVSAVMSAAATGTTHTTETITLGGAVEALGTGTVATDTTGGALYSAMAPGLDTWQPVGGAPKMIGYRMVLEPTPGQIIETGGEIRVPWNSTWAHGKVTVGPGFTPTPFFVSLFTTTTAVTLGIGSNAVVFLWYKAAFSIGAFPTRPVTVRVQWALNTATITDYNILSSGYGTIWIPGYSATLGPIGATMEWSTYMAPETEQSLHGIAIKTTWIGFFNASSLKCLMEVNLLAVQIA